MASKMGLGAAILVLCLAANFMTMANGIPNEDLWAVSKHNNEFTTDFYNVLNAVVAGNIIFSPYSIAAVMAMVYEGARGETALRIKDKMKFPEYDKVLFNGYKELLSSLKSDGQNFTLETVNRVYAKTGFQLQQEFTDNVRNYFGAEIEQLDFSQSQKSAEHINKFVSETTHDKIKDLVSAGDLDAMTRLILVNAIYFKGLWKNQFNKELTREADFHLSKAEIVKVPMMKIEAEFPYAEIMELDCKAVALPYQGDKLSMLILLPNEVDGLPALEQALSNFSIAQIPSRLRERKINLSMPKFRLETTIDLKGPLTTLGVGQIFDEAKADFSGIPLDTKEQLFVSKAVQKAFIEVNEEGSEAAAATAFQISARSGIDWSEEVDLNHPFLAMIVVAQKPDGDRPYRFHFDKDDLPNVPIVPILFQAKVEDPRVWRITVDFWRSNDAMTLTRTSSLILMVLSALRLLA